MLKFTSDYPVDIDELQIHQILTDIRHDPMGGWFDLPETYDRTELSNIKSAAQRIQTNSKYLVCIGIGGSYLGHRAIIEALNPTSPTKILYAGNSLSPRELANVLETIGDADFSVNIISKSGTTTEPAVAFRFFKEKLQQKYGDQAAERIFATTDAEKGALHDEAKSCGYERFVVPDNIGGRYSVLSAVGLLPLAVAGVNIEQLLDGANHERQKLFDDVENYQHLADNSAVKYAATRAKLLSEGFDVEVLASFEPSLHYFEEWWKQLFGESEGKNQQGIFPTSVTYTTDLHSLGQYLQEGRRNIFETMLEFAPNKQNDFSVPGAEQNLDGLQYLAGQKLSYLNATAMKATVAAHREGGIPVLELSASELSASTLGELVYFFELACALSAKLSDVNPFDQPGVEAYKRNMFHLLGKPGF